MKVLKLEFTFLSLLMILAISVFLTSCHQESAEVVKVEEQEFKVKETYTIYAPEGSYSLEELMDLDNPTARQNFVDQVNENYPSEAGKIESRYCSGWTSWQSSGYPCEVYRWRYCGHSGYYAQDVQFMCNCTAYPACL